MLNAKSETPLVYKHIIFILFHWKSIFI